MAKASINFKPVRPNSLAHNLRETELDYVRDEWTAKNEESWIGHDIHERQERIERTCKEITGRKLQSNANPIKEAIVNIKPETTMNDLRMLGKKIKEQFGVECFQIHIHRDEGRWIDADGVKVQTKTPNIQPPDAVKWKENLHAHMVFDWQHKEKHKGEREYATRTIRKKKKEVLLTGRVKKLYPSDMVEIQTLVAESLGMERGQMRVNGKSVNTREEVTQFKINQDRKHNERQRQINIELQKQAALEQKKNTDARIRNEEAQRNYVDVKESCKRFIEGAREDRKAENARIQKYLDEGLPKERQALEEDFGAISRAVQSLETEVDETTSRQRSLTTTFQQSADEIERIEASDEYRAYRMAKRIFDSQRK